jgi:hypothetical protein
VPNSDISASFVLLITIVFIDLRKPIVIINKKFIKLYAVGFSKKSKIVELDQVSKMKWYQNKKKITGGMILEIQYK